MNPFLSKKDKENLMKWKYSVDDQSITTKLFTPAWNTVSSYIPHKISPNVLSLSGFVCIVIAWWIAVTYGGSNYYSSCAVAFFTMCYMNLDALDGKHARNTKQSSQLGEIFDHYCDCIGNIFLTHMLLVMLNIHSVKATYLFMMVSQWTFFYSHYVAYFSTKIEFGLFSGPGEVLVLGSALIALSPLYQHVSGLIDMEVVMWYLFLYTALVVTIKTAFHSATHPATALTVMYCLGAQLLKYYLLSHSTSPITLYEAFSNGCVNGVLVGEVILSKIAAKSLSPLLVPLYTLTLFTSYLDIPISVLYFVVNVLDIAHVLRIPILGAHTKVALLLDNPSYHTASNNSSLSHSVRQASSMGTFLTIVTPSNSSSSNSDDVAKTVSRCVVCHPRHLDIIATEHTAVHRHVTREWLTLHKVHILCVDEDYYDKHKLEIDNVLGSSGGVRLHVLVPHKHSSPSGNSGVKTD